MLLLRDTSPSALSGSCSDWGHWVSGTTTRLQTLLQPRHIHTGTGTSAGPPRWATPPHRCPKATEFLFSSIVLSLGSLNKHPYPWFSGHIKQATTPRSWLRAVWNRMSPITLIFNEDWRQIWIIFIPVSPTSIFAEKKNELWVWKAILRGKM